jgi:hypothetical protein
VNCSSDARTGAYPSTGTNANAGIDTGTRVEASTSIDTSTSADTCCGQNASDRVEASASSKLRLAASSDPTAV